MRRYILSVHKWLGIVFGVFIAIECFTGAILVFRGEIANLLGPESGAGEFFKWVMRLHRWLLNVPAQPHGGLSVGRVVMGVSAMALTVELVTGVILWWPRSARALRSRLSVSVSKGWARFVRDTHVSLGVYACVFLLLMSLTGPVWSFGWYRSGATAVIGASEAPRQQAAPIENHRQERGQEPGRAQERGRGAAGGEDGHSLGRDVTGGRGSAGGRVGAQKTFISLHMGQWGGTASRVIYLLATVIGGFLPVSGYYMWLKKRKTRRSNR